MKEVTAYQDNADRLHKTKNEALTNDFIYRMQRIWESFPDIRDRGDSVVIARLLANNPTARCMLNLAIQQFEMEKDIDQ